MEPFEICSWKLWKYPIYDQIYPIYTGSWAWLGL